MNKKSIILIIICIVVILAILGISKIRKNKTNDIQNNTEINAVQNEMTGQYEIYDENGNLMRTLEDDTMVNLYKENPNYDPNPSY